MFADYLKERSLISTFLSTDRHSHLIDSLNEDDFYESNNFQYFSAIKAVHESGAVPGLLTVREELLKSHKKANLDMFVDVASAPSNSSEADFNCQKIIELSKKRKLRTHYLQQAEYLESPIVTPEDSCIDTEKILDQVYQRSDSKGKVYDACKDIFGLKGDYIPTGIQGLDDTIIGLRRSNLIVLASATSQGKTTLAQNIMQNNLDKVNLFFSLEMDYTEIKQRILSSEASMSIDNIVNDNLKPHDKAILRQTSNELKDKYKNLIIYDDIDNIKEIEVECKRRLLKHCELGIVVIDYLQLVEVDGVDKIRLQIIDITRRAKKLARKIDCPVILISQLSRMKDGEMPTLGHLKESGSIENDANVVIFIWTEKKTGKIWLIIAKNRQGKKGMVRVDYNWSHYKFQDYDEEIQTVVNL